MYTDAELTYEARNDLLEEEKKLQNRMEQIKNRLLLLQIQCNHEIVFMFGDIYSHKIGPMNCCFCPACNKIEIIHQRNRLENTCFGSSRVIDLTKIDYVEDKPFEIVKTELFADYQGFELKSDADIQKHMIEAIRGRQKKV